MDPIFIIQIIVFLIFLVIIIGMLIKAYYFSIIVKFIYSSTNNLFVTICLVAAIIFFGIALNETTREKTDKGFLENGGLYYIISAVLFILSFIINLISKRNTIKTNISKPTTIKPTTIKPTTINPTTIKPNINKKI